MRVAEYPLSLLHWKIREDPWVRSIFLAAGVPLDELAERILDVASSEDSEAMMSRSLALWERLLGITPEDGATMEERRADVRAMWLASLPPSIATIQAVCDAWRAGEIEAEYEAGIGTIVLTYLVSFGPQEGQAGLVRALDVVKPAHLALEHAYRYLRVKEVHRQMSVAELEATPRGWFAGYRARLLPGSPREYRRESGSVVSILSPQAWPLRGCTVEIRPTQEGSGDPSPSNVRAITGWTGAQIHVSSTTTAGDGKTYAVDWTDEAGTVYGGTLDVLSGLLTVTHAGRRFSTLTWTKNASANTFNGEGFTDRIATIDGSGETGCLCDSYPWYKSTDHDLVTHDGIALAKTGSLSTRLYVTDLRFTTVADLAASFESYDPLVVCPLAEPAVCQLTPQEATALAGRNNIWADCGDVTVEYASAESADYALSGKDRFRGSGILRFGDCLVVRERSKITVTRTEDRLDIGSGMTYEAPEYAQIGDGLWRIDGALAVAADSMVSARTDGNTLMITGKEG